MKVKGFGVFIGEKCKKIDAIFLFVRQETAKKGAENNV